jgi:CheY-like chemotaxis protein
VAHDFNNLLTVIVGGLDMMIRKPENTERVVRLAEAAMNAARRGEQLTQQLLAFSRRQMLRPQTINPNRLLTEFKPLAERAVGGALELRLDLDVLIDPIRIDPAQFEAAVLNLVVNARDAMEGGGSRIVVRSRNLHLDTAAVAGKGVPPGAYVEVAVIDQGSGIPPETMARVFEPFFTTKEVGKGTGLGLSQVYGFTRSAGGFIGIDTEMGAGTTFRLLFPRSAEPAGDEVGTGSSTLPLRRASEGDTVLLVEDDEQVLGMAVESLEELHYRVVVARNAAEAVVHLQGVERIDILFSDVMMPGGMNGSQLAVEAQRLRPGLKVLLTSGYVANLDEGQVIGRGDLPVLNKPYRRDELAHSLRLVLGGRRC